MKEITSMGSLGIDPANANSFNTNPKNGPDTVMRTQTGYEDEGDYCVTADGRPGKLVRAPTGGLICQVEGDSRVPAADSMNEAGTGLRFASASRMQIGKAYQDFVVNMRLVQGTGNLTISRILGTPGAWYFTVSSPTANQFLDPSKITTYSGVTVTQTTGDIPMAASAAQPKSVQEKVQERVKAILASV